MVLVLQYSLAPTGPRGTRQWSMKLRPFSTQREPGLSGVTSQKFGTVWLHVYVQERLANALAAEVGVTNKQLSQLRKSEREHLLTALTAWQLPIQVR